MAGPLRLSPAKYTRANTEIVIWLPYAGANATAGTHGIRFEILALPNSSSAAPGEEGPYNLVTVQAQA